MKIALVENQTKVIGFKDFRLNWWELPISITGALQRHYICWLPVYRLTLLKEKYLI
jgi:hypothetical protein